MENQIIGITSTYFKSMVLRDDELWLSTNKVSSLEKFEKAVGKTGMMKSAVSIPLTSVSEVSYNEASESAKLQYTNEKGKEKKMNIGFGDKAASNLFGQYLGEKLGFKRSEKQESQMKPLLTNGLLFLLMLVGTIAVGTMDPGAIGSDSGSRKSRRNGAFLKLLVDTVGQTGILVIGGLISAYLAYKLYSRYKNPSKEVLYAR